MKYFFEPNVPCVSVAGDERKLAVHRIYCVGKNYADHAREMGVDPDREPPFFFSKPANALVHGQDHVPFPSRTENLHYEVELVVALGAHGMDVSADAALDLVFGYGVGIDLTRRDLQLDAKQAGRPWDVAKGFDFSAPVSVIRTVDEVGHLHKGALTMTVNGKVRQQGDIGDMIWKVPEIISELSRYFELCPGDLIFTGTPAGVGKVAPGDVLHGELAGLAEVEVRVG